MEQFIYILKVRRLSMLTDGPDPAELAVLGEHSAYLGELRAQGKAALYGRTQNNDADTMGLVILLAEDEARARAMMLGDPAVAKNLMSAQLFPFSVAGFNAQALSAT